MKATKTIASVAATALSIIGAIGPAHAAENDVIAFNYGRPTGAYTQMYVAEDLDLFTKHGLKPTFFNFQSGAPLLAALKSGSLDVVTTGLASVFALGQGIPIKFLFYMGDAARAEGLVARKDAGIRTVKDLTKAKNVGAAIGTCAQISLYWAAQAAGTDYSKLSTVNIAPPLYHNAFRSSSIDAGIAWAPYSLQLADQGDTLVGFDPEWVPGGGTCPEMTIATDAALASKPELARRLLAVQSDALEAIKKDPTIAAKALAKRLTVPEKIAQQVVDLYFKDAPTLEKSLDPKSRYAMVGDGGLFAQLKLASDTYVKLGVLKEPIPDAKIHESIDASYLKTFLTKSK